MTLISLDLYLDGVDLSLFDKGKAEKCCWFLIFDFLIEGCKTMNIVPIKTQRIIMYIPYVNVLNIFFWLYNSLNMNIPYRGVPQTLKVFMMSSIPLVVLQTVLSNINGNLGIILGYLNGYLIPLFIGMGLIKYQERLTKGV